MANKAMETVNEEVELNLTPMIDVVFNLIIFFMIITDLSQKEIEVLRLPTASEDQEDTGEDVRVIINIAKKPDAKGQVDYWKPGDPIVVKLKGDPVETEDLWRQLRTYAEIKRDNEHASKPSEVFVLVRCDADIRWREVQWVMQAAAHPDVRIYKLQFATAKREQ